MKTAGFPTSISEWETYIGTLTGDELYSKAFAANTQRFADTLRQDGHSLADVQKILLWFVRRLVALGIRIPRDGAYDLVTWARSDPVARLGPTTTSAISVVNPVVKVPDDVDRELDLLENTD